MDKELRELELIITQPVSRNECQCEVWKWGRNATCPTCTAQKILALFNGYLSPEGVEGIFREIEELDKKVPGYITMGEALRREKEKPVMAIYLTGYQSLKAKYVKSTHREGEHKGGNNE